MEFLNSSYSKSLPNFTYFRNTSSATLHYLIAGSFWDPVFTMIYLPRISEMKKPRQIFVRSASHF